MILMGQQATLAGHLAMELRITAEKFLLLHHPLCPRCAGGDNNPSYEIIYQFGQN